MLESQLKCRLHINWSHKPLPECVLSTVNHLLRCVQKCMSLGRVIPSISMLGIRLEGSDGAVDGYVDTQFNSSCTLFISDIIYNRLGTPVELAGGVDVAGVHLIIVGHLAVSAAELCTQAAVPATVPLIALSESRQTAKSCRIHIKNIVCPPITILTTIMSLPIN